MPVTDYHEAFAALYDTMYADRDFLADARYAAGLLDIAPGSDPHAHVLDIGCGCGSHVLALATLGVAATGVDRSEAMIAEARSKPIAADSARVRFEAAPFDRFCASLNGHRFDAAISIFQVFNCMNSAAEMLNHLRLLRGRLKTGGRFLIDLWNGAAVFCDDPRSEFRRYECHSNDTMEIIRTTVPTVDRINQKCTLQYRILTIDRTEQRIHSDFESVHELMFLTPVQYRHLFALAGLRVLDEFRRGHPQTPITERDWYISYLLEAGA